MANQEQHGQDQAPQRRDMARSQQSGNLAARGGRQAGLPMSPGDLFRMSPFSLMRRMSEEMDRVLGEFGMNRGDAGTVVWAPAIEVSQDEGKYQVRAELPGVNPADVKIEITDDAVILEGDRKTEVRETKGGVQLTERLYGHFYRAVPLPEGAKTEEAKARFENGVVEITVPVETPKEKRRQIPIESGTSAQSTSEKAA